MSEPVPEKEYIKTETATPPLSEERGEEGTLVIDAFETAPASLSKPTSQDYDPRPNHDAARRYIAYWLLALLTILILLSFYSLFSVTPNPTFEQYKSVIEIILTPLLTLVSAATGFYFGSQTK